MSKFHNVKSFKMSTFKDIKSLKRQNSNCKISKWKIFKLPNFKMSKFQNSPNFKMPKTQNAQ